VRTRQRLARTVNACLCITILYNNVAAHDPTQLTEPLHQKVGKQGRTCR
jgi:hypothetical protein